MEKQLQEIGLSNVETQVYLALLKNGTSSVKELATKTKVYRTNLYDILEQLQKKGFVNEFTEQKTKKYSATNPDYLQDYLAEKQELARELIPKLQLLKQKNQEETTVQVFKGKAGIKYALDLIIKVKKDYVCLGLDEAEWEKNFLLLSKIHFRKEKELRIKAKIITNENTKAIFEYGNYRFVPEENFSPTPTIITGEYTINIIWNSLTTIIIKNKELADANKKHFELLWNSASTKPKTKVRKIDV